MKTIKILTTLINILFFGLTIVFIALLIFGFVIYFFSEHLPFYLQNFGMLFNSNFFSWHLFLVPATTVLNFILFIMAIFYLRKSITPFIQSDFYSESVTKNLWKAGNLFIFIGVSTIIIQLIAATYMQVFMTKIIQINGFITFSNIVAAAFDLRSIFLIIVGLFFLLFSKSFINARALKQENDLTI
ncbi:DUF2975 domain-containing protein [Polaribacter litorisediminis]|uniref:DUF2975 domain-containing protein n=1 Tax=Polaribacter litorisediminis TaxID=1908341 RepID=UPI001CBE85EF|nr:DUF2975 domain-containing protein [Polaribacter litorisediminis]UAM96925.1 DUF2975 domain-containing protein [Polaribacter litorisediminis]